MAWEEEQEGTAEITGEEDSGGKKKSLLKLIIFIVIALAVLGGVGYGVKVFFFSGDDKTVEDTEGTATEGGEEGNTVDGENVENPEEQEIIEGVIVGLEPFVVNLSDPQGRRYLKAKIRLEVDKQELLDDVSKPSSVLLYRTRDAILEILASKTVEEVLPVENRRDLRNEIKFRLNRIYDRSSIKAKVLEVYFTEFLID